MRGKEDSLSPPPSLYHAGTNAQSSAEVEVKVEAGGVPYETARLCAEISVSALGGTGVEHFIAYHISSFFTYKRVNTILST